MRPLAATALLAALTASQGAFAANLCVSRDLVDGWLAERGYRVAFTGRMHHAGQGGLVPFAVWLTADGRFATIYTLADGLVACQLAEGRGWHEAGAAIPRGDLRP